MEVKSYSMKYKAFGARERDIMIRNIRQQIDEVQDSKAEVDIQRLQLLTKVVQDLEDSDGLESATQMLAKYNLEGERPTRFFSSMNKKRRKTAQFTTLVRNVVDEQGNEVEETLTEQSKSEEEVHNYYKDLYKNHEVEHTHDEIIERIGGDIKKISEYETEALENPIGMSELNDALLNTRNNVSTGVSGFSGSFYKVFWKWLK